MRSRILRLIATLAVIAVAACSSGLQGTPMVPAAPQSAPQSSGPSVQPDQADSSDPSSDDTVPISEAPKAMKAAHRSPAPANAPSALAKGAPAQSALRYACRHPAQPGRRECDAILVARALSVCNRSAPYCASDLQAAYGLAHAAKANGKGISVAVVDAYGYPDASSDLAVYRKRMGLRACSVSNRCLRAVNQLGQAMPLPKPAADPAEGWRAQEALDLDMVSAICPNCRIVLVQTNSNKDADLAAGVNAAAALGAAAIGNSYSGSEGNGADAAYARGGRAIVSSGGNDGAAGKEPCGYSAVVCVGGTTLVPASGHLWTERVWHKAPTAAISAVADPQTGVAFYESAGGGWQQAGGTGVSAPIIAALFALGPSSARANAPAWLVHHDAARVARAATKMGIVK